MLDLEHTYFHRLARLKIISSLDGYIFAMKDFSPRPSIVAQFLSAITEN